MLLRCSRFPSRHISAVRVSAVTPFVKENAGQFIRHKEKPQTRAFSLDMRLSLQSSFARRDKNFVSNTFFRARKCTQFVTVTTRRNLSTQGLAQLLLLDSVGMICCRGHPTNTDKVESEEKTFVLSK